MQRYALSIIRATDTFTHELLGYVGNQFIAVTIVYQLQHHVHRCLPAGTGDAIAVKQKQIIGYLYFWKLFPRLAIFSQ